MDSVAAALLFVPYVAAVDSPATMVIAFDQACDSAALFKCPNLTSRPATRHAAAGAYWMAG